MTQILVKGDFSGRGLPNVRRVLPELENKIRAAHLFGSDFPNGPGYDYSGNRRHANVEAATINPLSATLGTAGGRKIVYPYTTTQMVSAAGNAAAMLVVVKTPMTSPCFLIGGLYSTEPGVSLVVDQTNNGRALLYNGSIHQALSGNTAPDAARAERYEMLIANYDGASVSIIRRFAGGSPIKNTLASTKILEGTRQLQSGVAPSSGGYAGPFDIVAAATFRTSLTDAECETAYLSLQARLAEYDVAL